MPDPKLRVGPGSAEIGSRREGVRTPKRATNIHFMAEERRTAMAHRVFIRSLGVIVLSVLCMLFAFAPASRADMPVTFLPIEPAGAAHYGWGYNLTTKQFTAPCVQYNPSATYPADNPVQDSTFEFVENTSEIVSKSNLSVSASLKVLTFGGTYKVDNKTDVAAGTESSTYSQALFANTYRYNMPMFLDIGQVSFKPAARSLLTTPGGKGQFKQQCGDAFVLGVQTGREFVGTATITRQTLKSWTQFASTTGASASGAWGSASGSVDVGKLMEQTFGAQNIVVKTYSTGSNRPNPTKASELTEYFQTFLNSTGAEKTVKLILAPYQLVGDYPWENPLQETTKDDYIGMMVVGLWELKAAIRDANFILDPTTAGMFAIGSQPAKRSERVAYIRQLRDAWQREYESLLKAAQRCNDQFTPACRSLAEFYDRNRNLAAQRYAAMPDRYLSDCYQPMVLKDVTQTLKNELIRRDFGTPVLGDTETGGAPSRVVAELTFRPDKTQLKAALSVMKMEWNRPHVNGAPIQPADKDTKHYSTWALQAQATVFDLENPQRYGFGSENLRHCTWKDAGVDAPLMPVPPAMPQLYQFGFGQKSANGYVDGRSGAHPRGQVHFGNGRGALEFITCEVDRTGKDNNLQCTDLGVRNVSLRLTSLQDMDADRWQRPAIAPAPPTALASFERGQAVSAADSGQFKPYSALLAPAQKTLVQKAETRRTQTLAKLKTGTFKLPQAQINLIQKRLKPVSVVPQQLPR